VSLGRRKAVKTMRVSKSARARMKKLATKQTLTKKNAPKGPIG